MTDEEKLSKKLIEMKLHERLSFSDFTVLRVHIGWIYTFTKKVHCNGVGDQTVMTSVFVPT